MFSDAIPHTFPFTPDIGIVLLTFSILLIFLELNRPGLVLPGAIGLLGVLLAGNALRQWHLSRTSLLLLLAGSGLCFFELRQDLNRAWTVLPVVAFVFGFAGLVDGPAAAHVHGLVAMVCGTTLGAAASSLARIAHHARQNKGLN